MPTTRVEGAVAQEIVAEIQQHFVSMVLSRDMIAEYINTQNVQFTEARMAASMAENMVFQLLHMYYGYEVDRLEFKYPDGWWEALRERWFPKWWLSRWPIQYVRKVLKSELAFMELPIRDHKTKVFLRDISSHYLRS